MLFMTNKDNNRTDVLLFFLPAFCFIIIFSGTSMAYQTREICQRALQGSSRSRVCSNHAVAEGNIIISEVMNEILSVGLMRFTKHKICRTNASTEYFTFNNIHTAPATFLISLHINSNLTDQTVIDLLYIPVPHSTYNDLRQYSYHNVGKTLLYALKNCGNGTDVILLCPFNPEKQKRSLKQGFKYYIWDTYNFFGPGINVHPFLKNGNFMQSGGNS